MNCWIKETSFVRAVCSIYIRVQISSAEFCATLNRTEIGEGGLI